MFDEIPHGLNGVTEVQKIYSWDGSVTNYNFKNHNTGVSTSVVYIAGNKYDIAIRKLSDEGTIVIKEPSFTEVQKAYDFKGVLKGYTCGCGFVPIDDSNALFKLIIKDIDNGKCIVKEPEEVKFAWGNGKIDHVKLYYIPEAVMHIDKGILEGEIEYTINGFIEGESYKYKVENINLATGDYWYNLTKKIQGEPAIAHLFDQIEYTLMEIELPVKQLARAFKNHQSFEFSKSYCSYLDMFYDQYVAQYGKDVPDPAWLLLHAPSYLYKVFLEIFNRLIGNYNDYQQEKRIHFINILDSKRNFISYHSEDKTCKLINPVPINNLYNPVFDLSKENRRGYYYYQCRILYLFNNGMVEEAVLSLSAFNELVIKTLFFEHFGKYFINKEEASKFQKMGLGRLLDLLIELDNREDSLLKVIKKVYEKRHLVAHAFHIDKKPYFDLYEKEALLREYLDYLKDTSLDGKYIGLFCGLYSKNEGVIWKFVECYIRDSQSEGSI